MTKTSYKGTYTIYPITLTNNEKSLYISEIRAKIKGCGYGNKLLDEIIEYATKRKMSICLHANANYFDEYGLNQYSLEDWYIRRGFEHRYDLDPTNSSNFYYHNHLDI